MALKAEAAAVAKGVILLLVLCFFGGNIYPQDIPESELQVKINSYFDNFGVIVIYPTVDYTKQISKNTSISGRYVSDIISAASMKSNFQVDGLTSATSKKQGGGDNTPDEWRNEFGAGIKQRFSDIIVSLNGSYSTEHDYSSKTGIFNIDIPFAKKNTVLNVGLTASFDKIFPQVWTWTKDRKTYTASTAFTQIFSKNIISQLDASYTEVNGYMLDGYQVVRIVDGNSVRTLEPVEPDKRIRKAVGIRTNIGITQKTTLQLGYRYYWDTWDVRSHTASAVISRNFSDVFTGSIELRYYIQSRAYFFKPAYDLISDLMTVDSKLNSGFSDEVNFKVSLKGKKGSGFLTNENMQLIGSIGLYQRHYNSPDWHSDLLNLYATLFSIGMRYHF